MRILVSIDDTDDLESRGTGELAALMAGELESNGWGRSSYVTRHQLYVHPDIPYTSHNSAMCFAADIDGDALERVIDYAATFLARESAVGSDPGLCVASVDTLSDQDGLLLFGQKAKSEVLAKEDAYAVARCSGVYLSEHGGTGQGVIGALAGMALRLSGNDGRLRGQIRLDPCIGPITVAELCRRDDVDLVRTLDGVDLAGHEKVRLGEKTKTVLQGGKAVLLVTAVEPAVDGVSWRSCSRQQLRRF